MQQKFVAVTCRKNQISLNLCDFLRRHNSVAKTKIFTKILWYTPSNLSLRRIAATSGNLLPSVYRPLQYFCMAASSWVWRTTLLWHVLLSNHVEHISFSIFYHFLPSTALQKQLPLLKDSGFGNWGSLAMCSSCLKISLFENLKCMIILIGGGNPEYSKPCSPIIFIVFWGILISC